ncbi:MAG: cation:proton antiporter [Longimicrobiaceae bacterium]
MTALTVLLLAAAVAFGVARRLRLPAVPLLMVAGAGLSLAGLVPPLELLENAVILGLTFLVFTAGAELNPNRVERGRGTAAKVGVAQFALLGGAGFVATLGMGFSPTTSLYLALAVAASSTLVVVRLLQRRGQLFEPFGRLVIGVLLLQDTLVILLIPVATKAPEGWGAVAQGMAGVAVLVGLAYLCFRRLAPFLASRLHQDEEAMLLAALAILFVMAGLSYALELPLVAGAFLAGVALSGFPVSGLVRGPLSSLSDFFLAIFFTALGALVSVPSPDIFLKALILSALVVVLTPLVVTVVAERAGLSSRVSIEAGLLLAQTSEFSLVIGLQGLSEGHVEREVFTLIALVTALTMLLTPLLATDRVTWRLLDLHPLRRRDTLLSIPSGHVLLLGCGDNGLPLLETLLSSGYQVLVVDDDPSVIARLEEGEVPAIRGDGSDLEVLRRAGAKDARIIVSTMRRARDSQALLQYLSGAGVPVLVRVFDADDARRIEALGGTPVLYSRAAADDFVKWLDQAEEYGLERERRKRPRSV